MVIPNVAPRPQISRDYSKVVDLKSDGTSRIVSTWRIRNVGSVAIDLAAEDFFCYTSLEYSSVANVNGQVDGAPQNVDRISSGPGLRLEIPVRRKLAVGAEVQVQLAYDCQPDGLIEVFPDRGLLVFHENYTFGTQQTNIVVAEPVGFKVQVVWPGVQAYQSMDVFAFPPPERGWSGRDLKKLKRGRLSTSWNFTLHQGNPRKAIVAIGRNTIPKAFISLASGTIGVIFLAVLQFLLKAVLHL